jgi:hypothetical protein
MEITMTIEIPLPAAYSDITELSDDQTEADTKVFPAWMAGIELETIPKCFAVINEKMLPVVGIECI